MSRDEKKTAPPPPTDELGDALLAQADKRSALIKQLIQERDELVTIAFKVKGLGKEARQ